MTDEKINEPKIPIVSEILSLIPENDTQSGSVGTPQPTEKGADTSPAAPSLPFPDLPGLGNKWLPTTDEGMLKRKPKAFLEHTKLLSQGTKVEDLEHYVSGRWRGCQCADCKTKRNEFKPDVTDGSDSLDNPKAFGTFITAKFFSRLLCLPNETMQAVVKWKKLPKEAEEIWKVPSEDIKIYEDFGKFVLENYLDINKYKHAQLTAFCIWYGAKFATTMTVMNAMIAQDKGIKK